jgi:hypothetical protein
LEVIFSRFFITFPVIGLPEIGQTFHDGEAGQKCGKGKTNNR